MFTAASNHLRRLASIPTSASGGRAIATYLLGFTLFLLVLICFLAFASWIYNWISEGKKKSTWTKIKIFWVPAFLFGAGTVTVLRLRRNTELAEKWESRLKMEALNCNEIDASSSESLKCMEFRKVKCKGVFDERKSILVLENIGTESDPFAYEYSLLTPLIPLPAVPQSVWRNRPVLVNRGRVPRDWADYRKIEKFQSLEIVRNFPRKDEVSAVSGAGAPPVEALGGIRSIIFKLQKLFSISVPRPLPKPRPVEFVGVIRTDVKSEWFGINVGALVAAVGLHPEATLYVEQIEQVSDGTTPSPIFTDDADILGRFSMMRKEHIQMMIIWYCCFGGTLWLGRWMMRQPLHW